MAHLSEVQRFIDTPIGDSFERFRDVWSAYDEIFNYPRSVGYSYPNPQLPGNVPTVAVLPPVDVQPAATQEGDSASPGAGPAEVQAVTVIDPEFRPQATVFENGQGPYVAERTRETDWDWVYDQYVILNAPETLENDVPFHDSIDWGEVAGGILGGVLDPFGVGALARAAISGPPAVVGGVGPGITSTIPVTAGAVMPANGCPPYGPKYAKICLATNVITPLRRRRRRRLLTSSDIKDLAALKAIVGGAALQGAVVQAIRR